MKRLRFCFLLIVLLIFPLPYAVENVSAETIEITELESQQGLSATITILNTLKNRDYEALSNHIHPEKGTIFSPYSYIDKDTQLTFNQQQVKAFRNDNTIYIWGSLMEDNDIQMTVNDYFTRYVYDKDFILTDKIVLNTIIVRGNAIENIEEIFPEAFFVEFYDSGSEYCGGLDWSSIKVVLEQYNGEFKLVALIHSSYTL